MDKILTRLVGALLLLTNLIPASTYFIDYTNGLDANSGLSKSAPWKKGPGMKGFNAIYAHQPGDLFIFKGGVVWPSDALPLTIANNGSVGNTDTYTTDRTWFSGTKWTQPTFDGELSGRTILTSSGFAYFKINDLRFINAGSLLANNTRGVEFSNSSNFEISNCTFALESWGGIYLWTSQSKIFANYLIHHNDISKSAFGIRVVPSGAGSIIQNVQIYNNILHDFHSQLSGEVHGDGIQHYCSPDVAASSDRYIEGFKIYNNSFTGDFTQVSGSAGAMTALVYLSGASKGVEIYNNLFAPEYSGQQSPNFFESFISLRDNPTRGGFHKIYGNTFVTKVANGQGAAIMEDDTLHPSSNLDIKNNIFTGFQWPLDLRSVNHKFDNNDLYFTKNVGKWAGKWVETFRDWQNIGNDIHGISQDPLFISTTNFHLHPNSPCVNRGTILAAPFAEDLDGVLRPQGPTFDLGAYETIENPLGTRPDFSPNSRSLETTPSNGQIRAYGVDGRFVTPGKNGLNRPSGPLVIVPKGRKAILIRGDETEKH